MRWELKVVRESNEAGGGRKGCFSRKNSWVPGRERKGSPALIPSVKTQDDQRGDGQR